MIDFNFIFLFYVIYWVYAKELIIIIIINFI